MKDPTLFPRFHWLERTAPTKSALADPGNAVMEALDALGLDGAEIRGKEIAVATGSRGVAGLREIVRAACQWLIRLGATPFVFPAMGSHGGATGEGQRQVLMDYGVTPEYTGAEIRSSMETILTRVTPEGFPVFADRNAWESDGVIVINRVKPHTRFSGKIESGLLKMMAIGMGKAEGAREVHRLASKHGFERVIRPVAGALLASGKIVAGVAVVENALHQPAVVRAALPANIVATEEEMLAISKSLVPRIPFSHLDLLMVGEIGKNISGAGMDTKVTGRGVDLAPGEAPEIRLIYARDLTGESAGNAMGVGMADIIHERLYRKIDFEKMYVNAGASLNPEMARLPMWFRSDREALNFALGALGGLGPAETRLAFIRNTLSLDLILISEALAAEARGLDGWRLSRESEGLEFDIEADLRLPALLTH